VSLGGTRAGRRAGLLVPLFSCPSNRSWGIGEFADLPALAAWMRRAGLSLLQLLPLNEMATGQRSPYSATSAMALDPIFIAVWTLDDFTARGGESCLPAAERASLDRVRASHAVDYDAVRALKMTALRLAFERFESEERSRRSARAAAFDQFVNEQAWWLDDYAVFRALHHDMGGRPWQEWPHGLDDRRSDAVQRARLEHDTEIRFRQYLQWVAHLQWQQARAAAGGVAVFGDLPFGVAADSADAWAHRPLFWFEGTIGAPPDAFSQEGQNWRLPMYRWDVLAGSDFEWFCARARRIADLFDGFRVDHVVGLFRTWVFPLDGQPPHFVPPDESSQQIQGRAVLSRLQQSGAEVVAEDLGTIPDFVRASLRELGVPGYRVLRWERDWHAPAQPFTDPCAYPACSLATSGTHDTDTLAEWWETLTADERRLVLAIWGDPSPDGGAPFSAGVRDRLIEALYAAGSDLLVLPIQDVFGWRDRINVPGVVDEINWTWRLPVPIDRFVAEPESVAAADRLRALGMRYARSA
jgi:4-alpha-glucanotransferase